MGRCEKRVFSPPAAEGQPVFGEMIFVSGSSVILFYRGREKT